MKNRKTEPVRAGDERRTGAGRDAASSSRPQPAPPLNWALYGGLAAAFLALWWAYSPSLHGPFLFDDNTLPYALPGAFESTARWLAGATRPVTLFSYWLNYQISGAQPFSYHVLSVLIHFLASGLVWLIVRKLLDKSGAPSAARGLLAAFAAALFLLHPAQAEAVAYIAGRSESLSVLFAYAAFAIFLYRPAPAISWPRAVAVLGLTGAAVLSKEHMMVLPALLLLTDIWWSEGSAAAAIRANWRLYLPMTAGGLLGIAFLWNVIAHATTAGFGIKDFTWYQYLFTQFRAIFVYLGMFLLPVNLTADWDFPISRNISDHGSIFGLLGLLALVAAAWSLRRRFPLASYGFFVFLLVMAPTSSVMPIKDPVAERRLYFSMIGLILVVVDFLGRLEIDRRALATACGIAIAIATMATHARAAVWASPVALWEDTVRKSPNKLRAHFQLASAYYDAGRYDAAIAEFERSARLEKPGYDLLVDWGLAYDAMNRPDDALAKLREAAAIEPSAHIYSQIAMVCAKQRRWQDALAALAQAERRDAGYAPLYNYRAKIHFQLNEICPAVADYRRALSLDPSLADARDELVRADAMARSTGGC